MLPRRTTLLPFLALSCGVIAAQSGRVEGVVINAVTMQPIRRADVILRHLHATAQRSNALGVLETDGEGRFEVSKLPAGEYTLEAQRPGYQSKTLRIEVGDGALPLRIKLVPKAVISGRVVDDEGEAVQNAQVSAMEFRFDAAPSKGWRIVAVDSTNDRGEFRLWGLPPGRYFVAAQWRQDNRALRRAGQARSWLPTYYPGALSTAEASPVVADAGLEVSGIEIALRRGSMHSVSGTVELPAGVQKRPVLVALQPKGSESSSYDYQSQVVSTSQQSSFRFESVRSASWVLTATTFEGEPLFRASMPVEVSGGDVGDLSLSMQPATQVRGKASIEGGKRGDFSRVGVSFDPEDAGQLSLVPARLDEEGSISGQLAAPGRYRIRVNGAPTQDSYLHSVQLGSQQILGSVLDAPAGALPPLTLEFRSNGGVLSGSVEPGDYGDEFAVVLLAEDEGIRRAIPIPDTYAPKGVFEFRGLRPGNYFVIAVPAEERSRLAWPETEAAIPRLASRVEIAAGTTTRVALKPVRLQP